MYLINVTPDNICNQPVEMAYESQHTSHNILVSVYTNYDKYFRQRIFIRHTIN